MKTHNDLATLLTGCMLTILLSGCANFEPSSCFCTTENRTYAVHIRNGSHVAIDSLITRSTIKRTGKTFVRSNEGDVYPGAWKGHYSVLADDDGGYQGVRQYSAFPCRKQQIFY
jgi:hypothetical protein